MLAQEFYALIQMRRIAPGGTSAALATVPIPPR